MVENTTATVEELEVNKELRDQLVSRVEVLEKVKELLLLPGADWMTISQVADYYEVDTNTMSRVIQRNHDELSEDGMYKLKRKEAEERLNVQDVQIERTHHKTTFSHNSMTLVVSNSGVLALPKRAVLRVGMLLRDSIVAREIRTQLLNIEEKTEEAVKTADINEEQTLSLALGQAIMLGDMEKTIQATTALMAFKNRHIQTLETENEFLTLQYNHVSTREAIRIGVNALMGKTYDLPGRIWNRLYKEMYYKHGVNPKSRKGAGSALSKMTKEERKKLLAIVYLECEKHNIDLDSILKDMRREK